MSNPFPMMFHPTLIVYDLEVSAEWFRRVFGRKEVRWEEKWDIDKLNPTYPINYSYFFVLGDVCLDVLCPSLLKLPGDREALYPRGEGLVDIAWYAEDIQKVSVQLEANGFRSRDQEGNIIVDGDVGESNLIADCFMTWTLPEDTGLTYEFFQMGEQHHERYSRRGDPRLNPAWQPRQVDPTDPLGVVSSAFHTVLTTDLDRARRLFVGVLGGQLVREGYNERLDADSAFIRYAGSVLHFASPRSAPVLDVLSGQPTDRDQYLGISFEVVDLEKVAAHLTAQGIEFSRTANEIATLPAGSKGAEWTFVAATN